MPLIPFPDVPNVLGVPPLARNPLSPVVQGFSLIGADGPDVSAEFQAEKWGVFSSGGDPVIMAESVVSLEYAKDFRISDYPTEEGGFQSYNKVAVPFDVKIVFAQGGVNADRSDFLNEIDTAIPLLDLYSVVTPDATYPNVNIVHYSYRRTSQNGAKLLQVEVWLREVRISAKATFTNTKSASGADTVNDGAVQPATPTPSQSAQVPAAGVN